MPLIREALRGVLVELQHDAVVLEAGTCGEAMALIQQHPDLSLVLLDLKLPDRDGFDVMAETARALSSALRRDAVGVQSIATMSSRRSTAARSVSSRRPARATCWSARCGWFLAGGVYIPPDILTASRPRR